MYKIFILNTNSKGNEMEFRKQKTTNNYQWRNLAIYTPMQQKNNQKTTHIEKQGDKHQANKQQ